MSKEEIALQIILALIDKGSYFAGTTVEDTGKQIAELYNTIYDSINVNG